MANLESMCGPKIFAVQFSGHGSKFIPFLEEFKDEDFNLSLEEANQIALDWELRADTIGGAAQVVTRNGTCWKAEHERLIMKKNYE